MRNFLGDFKEWLSLVYSNSSANETMEMDDIPNSSTFYSLLKTFSNPNSTGPKGEEFNYYGRWRSRINFDNFENPSMVSSTLWDIHFFPPDVEKPKDGWNMRKTYRKEYNKHDLDGYVFYRPWTHVRRDYYILDITFTSMGFALVGVAIALFIFQHILFVIFVIIIVVLIDFVLFGWMWAFGIAIESFTYLQLVMAVGLTVDYVIHITHALTVEKKENLVELWTWREHLKESMSTTGASVLKGALTTVLGCFPLAFSQSVVYRTFFKLFLGLFIVAVAHGLLLVPSLWGEFHECFDEKMDRRKEGKPRKEKAT